MPIPNSLYSPLLIKIHVLGAHSDNKPFEVEELDEWKMWAMMERKKKGAFSAPTPPLPTKVASFTSKPSSSSKPASNVAGDKNKKASATPIKIPSTSKTSKGSSSSNACRMGMKDNNGDWNLPPHEITKKKMAMEGFRPSSVLEGAGRTLKGRDMRNVRNKVLGLTGFLKKAESEKPKYSK